MGATFSHMKPETPTSHRHCDIIVDGTVVGSIESYTDYTGRVEAYGVNTHELEGQFDCPMGGARQKLREAKAWVTAHYTKRTP